MRRPAQLRSMSLKSHVSQDRKDMLDITFWDAENVMRSSSMFEAVEPRVFRYSPRSGNQYTSQLYPFDTNTSDGIVAGPMMASTYMRSSAQLKCVVLKMAAKLR